MTDDVQAIKNIASSYAELLDLGTSTVLQSCSPERPCAPTAARRNCAAPTRSSSSSKDPSISTTASRRPKHVVTNLIVEIADDRRSATARSYYAAFQARPELLLQPIVAGRWHDRLERDDDG
jgi:hypothetical protein